MTQLGLFTQSETDQASSQRDTPANPLVKPGSAEAVKMTDTSGQKYFPLFSKSDQIGWFVKTFLDTSLWASTRCFLTWQTKPITQSKHFILELWPSTPHTEECDSGSSQEIWATPNTMDTLPSRSYEAMMRQATNGGRKNRRRPGNLREQIDPLMQQAYDEARAKANNQEFKREIEPQMWPTPDAAAAARGGTLKRGKRPSGANRQVSLNDQVKMWPTPRACTAMAAANIQNRVNDKNPNLETLVAKSIQPDQIGGSLNPEWVEWLMGYPEGWTDLED